MVETNELSQTKRPSKLQLGFMVFVVLAVLTATEFILPFS